MEKALKKFLKDLRLNESTISMLLGAMVVIVVGILIYNYFTTVGKQGDVTSVPLPSGQVELVEVEGKIVPKGLPTTHTVAAGEDLWSIAEKYYGNGYNWVDIAKENKLVNPNILVAGQTLAIPKTEVKVLPAETEAKPTNVIEASEYTVQKGDSLWSIAVRSYQDGYQWPKIAKANNLTSPNQIEVGMKLVLPR